jgi:hypothetical protein
MCIENFLSEMKKARDPFGRQAWGGMKSWSGHRADLRAQMAYRARPTARTVIAFRLKDRTVIQTDIAPNWISAAAMAPAVMDARMGMNIGTPFGLVDGKRKKNAQVVSRGRLGGMRPAGAPFEMFIREV